jgi:conjugal transfer pilus assembly protein TraB
MSNQNRITHGKQIKRFSLIAATATLLFGVIGYYLIDDSKESKSPQMESDLPLDHLNPQDMWMSRMENDSKLFQQKMNYLEDLILETKKREFETEQENNSLRQELSKLKRELKELSDRPVQDPPPMSFMNDPFKPYEERSPQGPVRSPLIELVIEGSPTKTKNVDEVIPAGTSVRAVLLSSVDVPCGAFGSSDPQPVKLRILDNGHLPKKVQARLKGGIVIGSVYGDLSNERVYMRLERLTQVRSDGDFIETDVTGYVTGEDGKYGVRGCVVDKSSKMVTNAALSGFFSGVGQYLQAAALANTVVPYGAAAVPGGLSPAYSFYQNSVDLAQQAGAQGAASAFDMLTDYFIKRAEQIRPVIEVTAGRMVDITFTHNAELGDLHTKNKVKEIRESCRSPQIINPNRSNA